MNETIFAAALLAAFGVSAPTTAAPTAKPVPVGSDVPIGGEFRPCKDCPVFIRVPDAPKSLRPIRFVSKYELTWNNYLASSDSGACTIRTLRDNSLSNKLPIDISDKIDLYRVNWPITALGPAEINCFIAWLQSKTDYLVTLPSAAEWEWFATAGRSDHKFPWGNQADESREALNRKAVSLKDSIPEQFISMNESSFVVHAGVRVGLYPPNPWSIYDLLGNVRELTSDREDGEDRFEKSPSKINEYFRSNYSFKIKGYSVNTPGGWERLGVNSDHSVMDLHDEYSIRVGFRLILTAEAL